MTMPSYLARRGELQTYFDRTAVDAWARLTSTAPLGRIRATVRAGRDEMRGVLMGFLPASLQGSRVLDAGCGTGALSVAAAERGANVLAVDLSPTLIDLARQRLPTHLGLGQINFQIGDMLAPELGEFDHVVAMDSLIHYRLIDVARMITGVASRTRHSIVFTFAPWSPALALMLGAGRLFPRSDRAPKLEPSSERSIRRALEPLSGWRVGRSQRVASGFYKSHAVELVKR